MKHSADISTRGLPLGGKTPPLELSNSWFRNAAGWRIPAFFIQLWNFPASQVRLPLKTLKCGSSELPCVSAQSTVTGHFRESETTICTGRTIDRHLTLLLPLPERLWISGGCGSAIPMTFNANVQKDGEMVSIVSCGRYLTAQLPRQVRINSFWYRKSISNCICDKCPHPWSVALEQNCRYHWYLGKLQTDSPICTIPLTKHYSSEIAVRSL